MPSFTTMLRGGLWSLGFGVLFLLATGGLHYLLGVTGNPHTEAVSTVSAMAGFFWGYCKGQEEPDTGPLGYALVFALSWLTAQLIILTWEFGWQNFLDEHLATVLVQTLLTGVGCYQGVRCGEPGNLLNSEVNMSLLLRASGQSLLFGFIVMILVTMVDMQLDQVHTHHANIAASAAAIGYLWGFRQGAENPNTNALVYGLATGLIWFTGEAIYDWRTYGWLNLISEHKDTLVLQCAFNILGGFIGLKFGRRFKNRWR